MNSVGIPGRAPDGAGLAEVRDLRAVQGSSRRDRSTASTASRPTRRTICSSWTSARTMSAGSTPRPASSASSRRRRRTPIRGAATWTPQDRLWFTEYRANKLAMFDTKTEKFTEWELPTPYTLSRTTSCRTRTGSCGRPACRTTAWCGSIPRPGRPPNISCRRTTNVRRVWVDNSTTPVTFWVGSNHGASIVKVEPLD